MAIGARVPLAADRNTAFARTLRFDGMDLTAANLRAQVRLYPDAPGDPLIDLPLVAGSGVRGLRLISVDTTGERPVSLVGLLIPEAVMKAMPAAAEPGGDLTLWWDLHVTMPAGVKQRRLFGEFLVMGGVTR